LVWQSLHVFAPPWFVCHHVWLKVAPAQDVVVWHVEQVVGKPAAWWPGLVVFWYSAEWQE
jgi:hypothetical protein